MSQSEIKFYYKNVTEEVLDQKNGITKEQFTELAKQTEPLIPQINEEIIGGKTRYGNLPENTELAEQINNLANEIKDGCENLVVLGIGGSALGNIALQTALNPYMYNIDHGQRKGPRLFVFCPGIDSFFELCNGSAASNRSWHSVSVRALTATPRRVLP